MNSRRRNTNQHITGFYGAPIYYSVLFNYSNAESGKVIFILGIESGHFSGLTSDDCTSCLYTSVGYTLDNLLYLFGKVFAAGDIVKEKKRFPAAAGYIVGTHGNTVDSHCIMFVHGKGYLQFRTYSIGSGYQNRLPVL